MKFKLLIFFCIFVFGFCSCVPYSKQSPTKMNYAITITDYCCQSGTILCENFWTYKDTLKLYNAGYYPKKRIQRYLTDMTFVGEKWYYVIRINK